MQYYEKLQIIKNEIEQYTREIFKVYGNELLLKLEDYNLLTSNNNCIETSTATGFIIEEFIVSKLIIYTENHRDDKIKIKRVNVSTINSSYDCYSDFLDMRVLINIKSEKEKKSNDAISSINKLYSDYVIEDPNIEKSFFILKINYSFKRSEKDFQNKIFIGDIYSFFLEEIDFSQGYKQDHRNWSEIFNPNSGRLRVSKTDLYNKQNKKENISYNNTKKQLENIFMNNLKIKQ